MRRISIYCFCLGFTFSCNFTYKATGQVIPDSALFAKEHPSPLVVRGFDSPRSSQKDYDDARLWGANVLRLQETPARYAIREGKELWAALPSYLDQLEKQVKRAKQAGLKVVVDLQEPPFSHASFERPEFWNRTDLADTFCRVWTEIARRLLPYKENIWVLGGWSNHPYKNWSDIWYSKDGKDWKELQSKGPKWKGRHEHSAFVFKNKIWIAGGMTPPLVNDVWSLRLPDDWSGE